MYCNNCNAYNSDNSRFCSNCGSELTQPEQHDTPYGQTYNAPYGQPYNSPYGQPYNSPYGQPSYQPTRYTNTLSIVAIILSVIFFNVFGLIFAILSLSQYNKYEKALRMGDPGAEAFGKKSKTYGIVSLVVTVISWIVIPIIFLLLVSLFASGEFAPLDDFNDPYFFEKFDIVYAHAVISNAIAAII